MLWTRLVKDPLNASSMPGLPILVGHYVSEMGRTRTAPAASASPRRLRTDVVNCQAWQNGYWPASTALAEEDLDVVLHLGDYIDDARRTCAAGGARGVSLGCDVG